MSLLEFISLYKPRISAYINDFFSLKTKQTPQEYKQIYESMRLFSSGGKLLRGCLVLFSYDMYVKDKSLSRILPLAAAVEITQSSLLIHDDIMDNDLLRRGKPSLFAQYIEEGKRLKSRDSLHYGIGMGIVAGDLGFFLGYELLGMLDISHDRKERLYQQYVMDMQYTAGGQIIDFNFSNTPYEPSEEEILHMYRLKTAQYSLVDPFVLGAIAAGADDTYISQLTVLCEKLGIIFQIKDDELGLMGNEETTGKIATSDIKENKKTLIRKYLFDVVQGKDKDFLMQCFGNSGLFQENFEKLKVLVVQSGVQEKVHNMLDLMANETRELIRDFNVEENYKKMLFELVDYSLRREK